MNRWIDGKETDKWIQDVEGEREQMIPGLFFQEQSQIGTNLPTPSLLPYLCPVIRVPGGI